jgi:hypothetical protein
MTIDQQIVPDPGKAKVIEASIQDKLLPDQEQRAEKRAEAFTIEKQLGTDFGERDAKPGKKWAAR